MKALVSTLMLLAVSSCALATPPADSAAGNHPFDKVVIGYASGDNCSFQYSPVAFCDDKHLAAIKDAIQNQHPNFDGHYILLSIPERARYFQKSLVAIDATTGIVYPLPFDFYSGTIDAGGKAKDFGKLDFGMGGNQVCVDGSIVAAHEINSGKLCWTLAGDKFVGHRTPYTDG